MGWPGPMTRRQFVAWHEWLAQDMNEPGKPEWYLMAIRDEIRRVLGTGPTTWDDYLKAYKLNFGPMETKEVGPVDRTAEYKQRAEWSKTAWGGALGAFAQRKPKSNLNLLKPGRRKK